MSRTEPRVRPVGPRRPLTARVRDDSGAALVLVVAVGAILSMLMTLLVVVSVNGMRQANQDADWNAALAAAYAGIDEYQSRLSADTSYHRFGNSASSFSAGSTVTADSTNPAFGVGASGTWATMRSSDDTTARGEFRYEVDNSTYGSTGRIRIRSTGRVGDATRTLIADLKQQGFIDFLYFTDLEVSDPAIAGTPATSCFDTGTPPAIRYGWNARTTNSDNPCNDISFGAFDTIDGPVHSNDTIRACGTTFKGMVTTGKPTSPYYLTRTARNASCSDAIFEMAGSPAYGGVTGMPATNSELKKETRTDLTATDVPRPGCLYTGPTQFTFNADGTVNIKSPFTKATRIGDAASTAAAASTPAACGTISALQSVAGATIAVPDNNVVYVQNVPAVSTDANYWAPATNPANFTCTTTPPATGTSDTRGWRFGTGTNPPGYPLRTGVAATTEVPSAESPYGCRVGDAFVKGQFKGALTLAAENSVFIVGDITYVDQNADILGLVGNNAIWVYNPVNSSKAFLLPTNRTVHAAILSLAHTFIVQNYAVTGSRGTLTVRGAIAQKYRGPVATANQTTGAIVSGYGKNYVYDTRFKYKAPPKFLNPVTTTYGVTSWVETAAAWRANGAAR